LLVPPSVQATDETNERRTTQAVVIFQVENVEQHRTQRGDG